MARQFGYAFPRTYDIGVTCDLDFEPRLDLTIRLDHVRRTARIPIDETDGWCLTVARESHTLVHEWLEQHPHCRPSREWMVAFLAAPRDQEALLSRVRASTSRATFALR
jgi:hypothetical protein